MELIIKIAAGIMLGSVVLPLLICAVIWLLYLLCVGVNHFIMQIGRLGALRKAMKDPRHSS